MVETTSEDELPSYTRSADESGHRTFHDTWPGTLQSMPWTPLDAYKMSIAAYVESMRRYLREAQNKPHHSRALNLRGRAEAYKKIMSKAYDAALRLGPFFARVALPSYDQASGAPNVMTEEFSNELQFLKDQEIESLGLWEDLGKFWTSAQKAKFDSLADWYCELLDCDFEVLRQMKNDRISAKSHLQDIETSIQDGRSAKQFALWVQRYTLMSHCRPNKIPHMLRLQRYLAGIDQYVRDVEGEAKRYRESIVDSMPQGEEIKRGSKKTNPLEPMPRVSTMLCQWKVRALRDSHKSRIKWPMLTFAAGQIIEISPRSKDRWLLKGRYIDITGKTHTGLLSRSFVAQYHPEIPSEPSSTQSTKFDQRHYKESIEKKMEHLKEGLRKDVQDWIWLEEEIIRVDELHEVPQAVHEASLAGYAMHLMLHNSTFGVDPSVLPAKLSFASPDLYTKQCVHDTLQRIESLGSWLDRECENYYRVVRKPSNSSFRPSKRGHDVRAIAKRMKSLEAWLDQNRRDYESAKEHITRRFATSNIE